MTFLCPGCNETYQPHWLARDGSGLCRTCAEIRDGYCKWADEHPEHLTRHPCSTSTEEPGEPCRYCGEPVPALEDGGPCPSCWQVFHDMTMADIKAVFAADGTFDVTPEIR